MEEKVGKSTQVKMKPFMHWLLGQQMSQYRRLWL